jgi:hypothetical protein
LEADIRVDTVEKTETRRGNTRREEAEAGPGGGDSDPDEVAWNTAVEAAPWLLGESEPDQPLEPDELYEKLEPFKQRVSDDIRRHGREDE